MAQIRQFAGIRYARRPTLNFANVIAPPYDVLDETDKRRLQDRDPHNIVNIDLPFMPPKSVGPDDVYIRAGLTMQAWLSGGVLQQDARQALYPYTQAFDHGGRTFHRRGLIALVRLSPFGAGDVVPHELTYAGPIQDRLKLMRHTAAQLSPIFGLYSDPRNEVTSILYGDLGKPELSGTLDGVRNDLWSVIDGEIENKVLDLLKNKPIYIADGHHRYTTALQYKADMEQANGGPLPPNHPANWCMFVLVAMQDPGLLILPTHRIIGGLTDFSVAALASAVQGNFELEATSARPDHADELSRLLSSMPPHTFGLLDGTTRQLYTLKLTNPALMRQLEPDKSEAWRGLDVAILQRYLMDEVLVPKFARANATQLVRAYTADAHQVLPMTDGKVYQLALMLRPTPLHALEDLGAHGEVMPQKSTYFYPKLATGMVINPLGA